MRQRPFGTWMALVEDNQAEAGNPAICNQPNLQKDTDDVKIPQCLLQGMKPNIGMDEPLT